MNLVSLSAPLIPLVMTALLSACDGYEPATNTPPPAALETTLRNVEPACVRNQVLNQMVSQGFTVHTNSEAALLVGRVMRMAANGPLTLRDAQPPPEERIRFEYTALGARDLRVAVQAGLLLYRDTGLERVSPARASAADAAAFEAKMQVAASRCR